MDKLETVVLSMKQGEESASCTICRFGCHVVSWKISSREIKHRECLWMSNLSATDGSAPIRGGIPVVWPQFADNGQMKLHGFAREKMWTIGDRITSAESDEVTLSLDSSDSDMQDVCTEWKFPYAFTISVTVVLTLTSLSMKFTVMNKGNVPLPFTGCLHTYLRTADSSSCRIEGLHNMSFVDKVDGYTRRPPPATLPKVVSGLDIAQEMISCAHLADGKYFLDRIYDKVNTNEASTLVLIDESGEFQSRAGHGRVIKTSVEQSASWPQWVVFNPWVEGKRGDKGPDFDDDGYKHMICLEPAVATDAVTVSPGQSWVGTQHLSVST